MSRVAIARNDDIGQAVDEALGRLDLHALIAGKIVAVKPNETATPDGDTTGVTQPDTLRAVLRHIKRFGPGALIVTGGSGAGETEQVMRTAGMWDVIQEEGAEFVDHNRPPFVEVPLQYSPAKDVQGPQQSVMVNPRAWVTMTRSSPWPSSSSTPRPPSR